MSELRENSDQICSVIQVEVKGNPDEFKNWVFLCGTCLTKIKSQYVNTYQYGGTWKNKKN